MAELQVTTISGPDTVLEEATVTACKKSLRGQLIAPGDARYAEARQVWNAHIDRLHPVSPVLAGPVFHSFAKAKEVCSSTATSPAPPTSS
jgi:hypothetical protein